MEIRRLTRDDFYPLRELLNTVFSNHRGVPVIFETLFPRLFGEINDFAPESHFGAFMDGKLVGTAAMYPIDYVVGGKHIRLMACGNVAVDENHRGQGIMSTLLKVIGDECDQCGDVCYLHGKPHRYGRVGFFANGIQYRLTFHSPREAAFTFRPMKEEDVPFLNRLSQRKTDYFVRRDEDFIPALRSGEREAVTVLDEKGEPIGYLSLQREKAHVEEYALAAPLEARVFPALAHELEKSVTLTVSGYDPAAAERCRQVASVEEETPALFRIIHKEPLQEAAKALGLAETVLFAPYLT